MPQNQEIIEAKLCAYIDDELDAAGRADIEKHLAANPQHRRLIEELRRTSALVHDLPHESAPPELAEAFNAQLERSVLLEGVSEAVAGADMKMRRWPQIMALAAITLLTVGLAVVVYFALPGIGNRPQLVQAAVRTGAGAATSVADQPQALADASKAMEFDKQAKSETTAGAEVVPSPAAALSGAAAPVAVAAMPSSATDQLASFRRVEQQAQAKPVDRSAGPIVLVVRSSDPGQTRKTLVTYLVEQNVTWEPAVAPMAVDGLAASVPTTRPVDDDAEAAAPMAPPEGRFENAQKALAAAPAPVAAQTRPAEPDSADIVTSNITTAPPFGMNDFSVSCRMTAGQVEALRASVVQAGASMDALPADKRMLALPAAKSKDSPVALGGAFGGGGGGAMGGGGGAGGGGGFRARLAQSAGPTTAPVVSSNGKRDAEELKAATQPSTDLAFAGRAGGALDENRPADALAPGAADQAAAPTTAPASSAVASTEEPLQLLIIVRPTEAGVTDAPTTQPVAPAAAAEPAPPVAEPSPPTSQPAVPATQE